MPILYPLLDYWANTSDLLARAQPEGLKTIDKIGREGGGEHRVKLLRLSSVFIDRRFVGHEPFSTTHLLIREHHSHKLPGLL